MSRIGDLLSQRRVMFEEDVAQAFGWDLGTVRRQARLVRRHQRVYTAKEVTDQEVVTFLLENVAPILKNEDIMRYTGWTVKRARRASASRREFGSPFALLDGDWTRVQDIWNKGEVIDELALYEHWSIPPERAASLLQSFHQQGRLRQVVLRDGETYYEVVQ